MNTDIAAKWTLEEFNNKKHCDTDKNSAAQTMCEGTAQQTEQMV